MEQLWLPTFTPYDVYNVIETEDGEYELVPIDRDSEDLEVIMEEIKMSDEDILAFNDDPKRFMLDRDCWQLLCEETEQEWCERTGEKTTEMLLAEGYSWNAIRSLDDPKRLMLKKDEYPKFEGHFGDALNPDTSAGGWTWKNLAQELYEACLNAHDNQDTDSLKEILKHLKPVFEYKNKDEQ